MVSYSIAYETTVEDEQCPFPFNTTIPVSRDEDDAIHRGSFQEKVKVLQSVVEKARSQLVVAKSWNCMICGKRPATKVIGDCCNLEIPVEGNTDEPRLVHYNPSLVCSRKACARRAIQEDRNYCMQVKSKAKEVTKVKTRFFCKRCGKTEPPQGPKMKRCAKCRFVWYCDKSCQTADWNDHKKQCL